MLNRPQLPHKAQSTSRSSIARANKQDSIEQLVRRFSEEKNAFQSMVIGRLEALESSLNSCIQQSDADKQAVLDVRAAMSDMKGNLQVYADERVRDSHHLVLREAEALRGQTDFFRDECVRHVAVEEMFHEQLDELSKLLPAIKRMQNEIQSLRHEIDDVIARVREEFGRKLEEFKKSVIDKPSEIPVLKDEILKKLELVALDGTNSLIRSTNNEKQINLIEKKIENLYLMMKNIDLSSRQ